MLKDRALQGLDSLIGLAPRLILKPLAGSVWRSKKLLEGINPLGHVSLRVLYVRVGIHEAHRSADRPVNAFAQIPVAG